MEKKPKVIVFDLGTGKIVNVMFNLSVSQIYNNHINDNYSECDYSREIERIRN